MSNFEIPLSQTVFIGVIKRWNVAKMSIRCLSYYYDDRSSRSDEKVPTGKRERERKEGKRKRTPVRKPLHDPRIRKTLLYRERIN